MGRTGSVLTHTLGLYRVEGHDMRKGLSTQSCQRERYHNDQVIVLIKVTLCFVNEYALGNVTLLHVSDLIQQSCDFYETETATVTSDRDVSWVTHVLVVR